MIEFVKRPGSSSGDLGGLRKGRFRVRKVSRSGSSDKIEPGEAALVSPAKNSKMMTSSLILPSEKEVEVKIYDVSTLFKRYFDETLASEYVLHDDPRVTCARNSMVALKHRRMEVATTWKLCAYAANLAHSLRDNQNFTELWNGHAIGGKLIKHLVDLYVANKNYQMAAMIICAFTSPAVEEKNSSDNTPCNIQNSSTSFGMSQNRGPIQGFQRTKSQKTISENSPYVTPPESNSSTINSEAVKRKTGKFWFLKAGALKSPGNYSPYHTIASSFNETRRKSHKKLQQTTSDNDLEKLFKGKERRSNSLLEDDIVKEAREGDHPAVFRLQDMFEAGVATKRILTKQSCIEVKS